MSGPSVIDLIGQRVRLQTATRTVAEGVLEFVPAATRGNKTLAVVGTEYRADGTRHSGRRRVCLWEWRDRRGFRVVAA